MLLNTVCKKVNVHKLPVRESVSNWMEQDIIVPDSKPDSVKIIDVNVNCYIKEKDALDGKIKVSGNLSYYVMYKSDNSEFVSLKYDMPYTQVISVKGIVKNMKLNVCPKIKNIIYTLPNERKISVKTEVVFNVIGCEYKQLDIIEKFEDEKTIEVKHGNININNIECNKVVIINSNEDIMIPNENSDIKEIVKVKHHMLNKDYKMSYNKIMLKCDLKLDIMYITTSDLKTLRKFSVIIPVTGMCELDNMNDTSKFDIDYFVSDLKLDLSSSEISKVMKVEYYISADITMYNMIKLNYIKDFYSENVDLKYEFNKNTIVSDFNLYNKDVDFSESLSGVLKDNIKVIDYYLDNNNITTSVNGKNIVIDGSIKLNLLVQDMDTQEIESKQIEVLINTSTPIEELSNNDILVDLETKETNVVQNGNNLDLKYKLRVNAREEVSDVLDTVSDIEFEETLVEELDSIYIYIVKEGDTLWDIAKRYKTTVDKIVTINNIKDENDIEVGDKLLIIR